MYIIDSKYIWILLIIAIVGDFAIPYILAKFYTGYSHMKHVMSVLGNPACPVALYYNIWLIVLGVLMCISAVNIYNVYLDVAKNLAKIVLIILFSFGIGAGIIAGIFSVEEDKRTETIPSKIHGIGSGLGFLALTFIPLVIGLIFYKQNESLMSVLSFVFFGLSIILFILFVMSEKDEFKNSLIGLSGLWQRLLLASMYMPLLLIAINHI